MNPNRRSNGRMTYLRVRDVLSLVNDLHDSYAIVLDSLGDWRPGASTRQLLEELRAMSREFKENVEIYAGQIPSHVADTWLQYVPADESRRATTRQPARRVAEEDEVQRLQSVIDQGIGVWQSFVDTFDRCARAASTPDASAVFQILRDAAHERVTYLARMSTELTYAN